MQSYCSQASNFPSALNSPRYCLSIFFFSFSFSGFTIYRRELLYPFYGSLCSILVKNVGFLFLFFFFFFYSMDGFDPFRSLRIIVPRISPRSLFSFQPFRFYVFVFSPLFSRVYFVYLFSLSLSSIFGPGYFYLIAE